jgi:phage gp29-like protein
LLTPQDTVLAVRLNGDYALYEEILRDDQVQATFAQRRLAVVSHEVEVEAASESAVDQRAADHLREVLQAIRWDDVTAKMLFGVFYGFAVGECIWARDGGTITLETIKVRKQRRFRWTPDGELRLLTMKKPQGESMPERKFWTFSVGADNDDEPYGLGLAHWLYWPVYFKRNGIKFWLVFLEKFAGGTAIGKYPRTATRDDQRKLLEALRAIQTDSGVVLPEGMAIELLQIARSGTADYVELLRLMDAAISKVVLGQTMTTDNGSSLSQSQTHLTVRDQIVKADADMVCESFNHGPVRWLTEWNHPGAKPPRVWRRLENAPDLSAQATREKLVFDMGFAPTLEHVQAVYGGEWVDLSGRFEVDRGD